MEVSTYENCELLCMIIKDSFEDVGLEEKICDCHSKLSSWRGIWEAVSPLVHSQLGRALLM